VTVPKSKLNWSHIVGRIGDIARETEATYDWIAEQWSIPTNATVSTLVTIGEQKVSLEAGLRYWADSPAEGPDDLGCRISETNPAGPQTPRYANFLGVGRCF
jgi:hypothetical protein